VRAGPALAAALALLAAVSWVGTLASPMLAASSPLLLVALAPRAPFIALAAHTEPAPLLVTVALVRANLHAPLNFCVGWRYGAGATAWLGRRSRSAGWVASTTLRMFGRLDYLAVMIRPNQTVLILAGAAKLHPTTTGVCTLLGSSAYVATIVVVSRWTLAQVAG
jgi:hypothetical protein